MLDWKAFCNSATSLTVHFSYPHLKILLIQLDPGILHYHSLLPRLLSHFGLANFRSGRDFIFGKLFLTLLQRNPYLFIAAPPKAVKCFNALMKSLFSPQLAQRLFVSTQSTVDIEESVAPKEVAPEKQTAKAATLALKRFEEELHPISSLLYQRHVQEFIQTCSQLPPEEILNQIKQQKTFILQIDHFITEGFDSLKKRAGPLFQKLFIPQYMAYKDLPKEADRILTEPFSPLQEFQPLLSREDVAAYEKEVLAFNDRQLQNIQQLIDVAKTRSAKISEMEEFQKAFSQIIGQVRFFKDLHHEILQYEEQAKELPLSKHELSKASFEEIEKILHERFEHYEKFRAITASITQGLFTASKESERRCLDDKMAIKRRLFEIFWDITPYQDLAENVADLRQSLTTELGENMAKFYRGEITSREFLLSCHDMPYEHDVVKLRNEITHRSGRLKDLRDEAYRIAREVTCYRRLLELVGAGIEKVHRDFVSHQAKAFEILKDVENPFQAFSKASDKDAINYVFRNQWIRIEGLQPLVEASKEEAIAYLKQHAVTLKGAFLRALDSLEAKMQLDLVTKAQRELAAASPETLYDLVISQLHGIEKRFGFCQPFSYFMQISDHKSRLALFQEAIDLDARLDAAHNFTKNMQYVKTFEEEREDIILEAFERHHLLEDDKGDRDSLEQAWAHYKARMQRAAMLVEDEVFLDIGLIDRHGLMDVDPEPLNKALVQAIERAKTHQIVVVEASVGSMLGKKSREALVESIEAWEKSPIPDGNDTDRLLEYLRAFCHILFDAKVLQAASQGMLIPMYLQIMNDLRSLTAYLEEWLQEKRGQRKALWGMPWIPECYTIRSQIECFEPAELTSQALRDLVKSMYDEIMKIPEISFLKTTEADPLKLLQIANELEQQLKEIEALSKDPKTDHPFIYIPGFLAFFGRDRR